MQINEQIVNQSGRQADFRRSSLACRRIDNRQAVRQIEKQVEEEGGGGEVAKYADGQSK